MHRHRHCFFHKTHRSRHQHHSILPQFCLLAPDHKKEGSRLLRFLLLASSNTDHGQSAEDGDTGGDYFGNRDKGKDNEIYISSASSFACAGLFFCVSTATMSSRRRNNNFWIAIGLAHLPDSLVVVSQVPTSKELKADPNHANNCKDE